MNEQINNFFPLLAVATVATVQPTVVIQQQRRKPENYMVFAVLVTFFCNPVFGIIAWIFSCLSDNAFNEGEWGGFSEWLVVMKVMEEEVALGIEKKVAVVMEEEVAVVMEEELTVMM